MYIKETSRREFFQMLQALGGVLLASSGCKGPGKKPVHTSGPCSDKEQGEVLPMFADQQADPSSPLPGPAIKSPALATFPGGRQAAQMLVNKGREGFLKLYGKRLPSGTIILKSPSQEAVSEGVGFGGMIFGTGNSQGNQSAYWQLYKARKAYFLNNNGVMAWKIDASGRKIGAISASDGDQDWLASAISVYNKLKNREWASPAGMTLPGFKREVVQALTSFWNAHIKMINGKYVFLSTDGSWARRGDGKEIYYPSYPDPHFLRMFAKFDPSHAWAKVASDVQELNQEILKKHSALGAVGQNPMPAKVFITAAPGGRFSVENYYVRSKAEGVIGDDLKDNEMDSIRFFLRPARSAILDRDPIAQKMLKQILVIANISGPSSAFVLAGSNGAPSKWGWNNPLARAAYGLAVLGSGDTARAEKFIVSVLKNSRGDFFGEWDGAKDFYYDQALILQILDLAIQP